MEQDVFGPVYVLVTGLVLAKEKVDTTDVQVGDCDVHLRSFQGQLYFQDFGQVFLGQIVFLGFFLEEGNVVKGEDHDFVHVLVDYPLFHFNFERVFYLG